MDKRTWVVALIVFAVVAGGVAATRLDGTVWAAIAGAVCALAVGVPLTAAVTALVVSNRQRQRGSEYRLAQLRDAGGTSTPPVVLMPPPSQRGYPQLDIFDQMPARRSFSVIGDEGGEG